MALTRDRYTVALLHDGTGDPYEVEVEVSPGDEFRSELEARKHGIPDLRTAPLNNTIVAIWCALVRVHGYSEKFPTFRDRDLYAWEPVKGADGEPVREPVDPTREAGTSGPASPSPTPSPVSTGSTPTSTPPSSPPA